jgi:hypothetical protein
VRVRGLQETRMCYKPRAEAHLDRKTKEKLKKRNFMRGDRVRTGGSTNEDRCSLPGQ